MLRNSGGGVVSSDPRSQTHCFCCGELVQANGVCRTDENCPCAGVIVRPHFCWPPDDNGPEFVVDRLSVRVQTLTEDPVISDALGYLWQNAPARRPEIENVCRSYGLMMTVD